MLSEEVDSNTSGKDEDIDNDYRNLIIKYKITLEIEERNGDEEKLKALLSKLEDIDSPDANDNDNTLLHFAAKVGNDTAVEVLLKNGASVNKTNSKGQTPLQVAAFLSPYKLNVKNKIQTLLTKSQEKRDSVKMEEKMADNLLIEAQSPQTDENISEPTNKNNPERASYLLSKDDIENYNSEDIMKKINELFGQELPFATNTKKQQILQEIANEACDEDRNTALILCAKNKDSEKLKLFLNFEADVNKMNKENMRAADYSWLNRDYNSLLELYNKGSNFPKECSAIQVESEHMHEKELKKLISVWKNSAKEMESENFEITTVMEQFHNASKDERMSFLRKAIDECKEEEMRIVLCKPSISFSTEPNFLNKAWDEDGNPPLILSAKEKDRKILKYLLKIGADASQANFKGERAIEYSWKSKDYLSVLDLLKKDSYFHPCDVKPEAVSMETEGAALLIKFIVQRYELHKAIVNGNLGKVECITENQKSDLFLSPGNKSALFCAIESKQLGVHAFLLSKGANVTEHEKNRVKRMPMSEDYKRNLKALLYRYMIDPESPAKKLTSKSVFFGKSNDSNEAILNIYKELESSEYILPILNVLQFHPNLLITFSLNCESTKNKDLDDPDGTKGSTDFVNGLIHIAAKGYNCEGGQRCEVLGTLAHEMAHQAIHLTYNNQCNPYLKEEDNSAKELEEINMEICKSVFRTLLKEKVQKIPLPMGDQFLVRAQVLAFQVLREIKSEKNEKFKDVIADINKNFINDLLKEEEIDPIIKFVYTSYKTEYWHRELIVRIPHMIAKYGKSTGEEKLMKQVPKLFDYYKCNVIQRMEDFLKISPNLMSKMEAMEIFSMNGILGTMKAIDTGKLWLKNPADVIPHIDLYGGFKMVKTSSINLCTIYFYQILREKYKNYFHMQCLFIKMSNFEHIIDKMLHLAESEACKAIVLISDSSTCDVRNFAYRFSGTKAEIYVILNDKYPEDLETTIFEWPLIKEESKKALMEREISFYGTTVTLTQLLNSKNQQYEGIDFDTEALAILVEEKDLKIDDENESHLLEYDSEYYIERHFCKQIIRKDILSEGSREYILYITNVFLEDLFSMDIPKDDIHELINGNIKLGRRILIKNSRTTENDRSVFYKIKEKCDSQRKIIHWLHMENDYLIWKDSNGKIGSLENFVDADKKVKYEGELIAEENKKIVILADMPGMGKSTIFSKLQHQLKLKGYWTLRFHVFDLVKKLSPKDLTKMKEDSKMPSLNAINIIANIKFHNPLIKSIFKICCNNIGQIVLIFDGFDEMQNEFRKPIINLIKSLMSSQIMQIWISARSNDKVFLERELQVMALTLNDWGEKEQIEFVNKLWNKKLKSLDDDKYAKKCDKFKEAILSWKSTNENSNTSDGTSTDGFQGDMNNLGLNRNSIDFSKFLGYIMRQLNEELKRFVSIPLHTLILASVIFEENFRMEYALNIYELYKHFIHHTFQRYYDKCHLDFKNCLFLRELLNEKLLTASQFIVRSNLRLDNTFFHREINENNDLNKILDCFDKIGISTALGQFFHQNIAEYLFVEWIFVNSGIPSIQKFCVDTIFMAKSFSVVRQFISSKIEFMKNKNMTYSDDLHFLFELDTQKFFKPKKLLSILERMTEEGLDSLLKFFTEKFPNPILQAMNTENKKKQNLLHLACYYGKRNILDNIFEFIRQSKQETPTDTKRDIKLRSIPLSFFNERDYMNKTPFHYAIKTGDVKLVESFITKIEEIFSSSIANENLILFTNNPSDSALHTAVYMRNSEVLEFLWKKIKDYEMGGEKSLKSILEKRHQRSNNAITHIAAYNSCSWLINEIFGFLVKGNDFSSEYLNMKNDNGFTVLHTAVLVDDVVFLFDLISILGDNVKNTEWRDFFTQTDNWNDTALHKSAYRSHADTIITLLNLSKKILDEKSFQEFLFLKNNKGYTALHKSAFYCTIVYFEKCWNQLEILLDDKPFLDLVKEPNNYGNTILHTAASVGNLDMVKKLCNFLEKKGEIGFILQIDSDKDTVLHKASIKGQIDVLLYVADFVEMNMKKDFIDFFCTLNKYGNSVLHLAVRCQPSIHSDILGYASKKLTEEQFQNFYSVKNSDGYTFEAILDMNTRGRHIK